MRYFWHFFKSNIKYNKIELAISYGLTLAVFAVFFYFDSIPKAGSKEESAVSAAANGQTLISVAFYALLYAFFSNKKKFNLKYLVSLPVSSSKLLLVKSCADVVFFIPAMSLAFFGAKYSEVQIGSLPLIILLFQAVVMVSFFLFDSDVEQPRMENTRASFLNRLVYVRKMVDKAFLVGILALFGTVVYGMPIGIAGKHYMLIIAMFLGLAFKFKRSLKLMQDESLSYFIFKRDSLKLGWKVGLVAAPAIAVTMMGGVKNFYPSPYGKDPVFTMIKQERLKELSAYIDRKGEGAFKIKGKEGFTPVLAAINEGKVEALELLLEKGFRVSWKASGAKGKFKGFLPAHFAAASNNPLMMRKLMELESGALDLPREETKETPLMVAAKKCNNEMVDFLLQSGANPDAQNSKGATPLMFSVKNGCDASTALLVEAGASVALKDNKGKTVLDRMSKEDAMYYYVSRKAPRKPQEKTPSRSLASKETN